MMGHFAVEQKKKKKKKRNKTVNQKYFNKKNF